MPSDGRMAFSATMRKQARILGLKHHAHAAAAQHPEDAIRAEAAEFVGGLRRRQEVGQPAALTADGGARGAAAVTKGPGGKSPI